MAVIVVVVDQAKTHNLHTHTQRERKRVREMETQTLVCPVEWSQESPQPPLLALPQLVPLPAPWNGSVASPRVHFANGSTTTISLMFQFAIAGPQICALSLFGISAWKSAIIRRWHVACTLHNRFKLRDFRQTQFVSKLQLSSCANLILLLTQLGST